MLLWQVVKANFFKIISDTNNITVDISENIKLKEAKKKEKMYRTWCDSMESTPEDSKLTLKPGFMADIELQPHRWMTAGVDQIESFKGSAHVQLMGGGMGEPLHKVLKYPVFHSGCELFLKGMWLCQFEECRNIKHNMYVEIQTRKKFNNDLKKLGHNLIKIINDLRTIPQYSEDKKILRFLKRIEGVIRNYYYPLYEADKSREWANSRYPKRYYNDLKYEGKADALQTFPDQSMIVRSFKEIEGYIDNKFELRRGLLL